MNICIIDDDHVSIYITRLTLVMAGCLGKISSFPSAEEALQTLLKDETVSVPEVILLDLNMPGMNGWAFLDALAPYKTQILDRCRIFILSSSLDLADTARSKEYDLVCGFKHKPLDASDVQEIIFPS